MEILEVLVADLSQDPANARKHPERNLDTIVASLRRFGQQKPIVIDRNNIVRAGNGTLEAAKRLGWEKIDCVRTELNGADATAYAIADNRTAELAEWDDEILAATLNGLALENGLLEAAGYDEEELAAMLAEIDDAAVGEVTDDEVPEPPADPITKPGDLWILGRHRLLCGDSTNADDVAKLMNGAKADLCFTSPPYGAGNVAKLRDHYVKGAKKRESFYDNHKDDPSQWLKLMRGWYQSFRESCDCVVCNVQMLADNKRHMVDWLHEVKTDLVDVIIWDKSSGAPQMQSCVLTNVFEFCFVLGGNGSRSIPFADWHGTVGNMVRIDPRGKNEFADDHRATMPVALPAWIMNTLCPMAESVVEPFCGTGTTLIAAEQLGRKCYGMEISPQYCDVIVKRWENLTGEKAVCQFKTHE
jgi:DNA modification methylase